MKMFCDLFGFSAARKGIGILFLVCATSGMALAEGYSQSWTVYYYLQPRPESFVSEVQKMSKAGALSKGASLPPMIAFLSRVMAQNPDKISEWMKELNDLPAPDKRLLYSAIWYSNTGQGKEYFRTNKLDSYLKKEPPDILKMEPDNPATLDMLWGYFAATGDSAVVSRVVSALNYARYNGAMEKFKASMKTEEDKKAVLLDSTYQTAHWSLVTNCIQHPKVMETCEALLKGDDLSPAERKGLEEIVAQVHAERGKASSLVADEIPEPEKPPVHSIQESPVATPSTK